MATPTKDVSNWQYQDAYVERIMDNAAYTAAHPDDTLVMAGPPRKSMVKPGTGGQDNLYPIGMMQAFQATQAKPVMPLQSIGSGRSFFVSGKSAISFNIGRLFVKGRNLIRVLYNNAMQAGIDVSSFDEQIYDTNADYFVNLDSELLLIPFGMAVLFRDKSHNQLGGFYLELCMINNWAVGLNAGQNMMMENVTGLCDRLLPYNLSPPVKAITDTSIDNALGFTTP